MIPDKEPGKKEQVSKPQSLEVKKDMKLAQAISHFWGDLRKGELAEIPGEEAALDGFLASIQQKYDLLASPKQVEYLHQFKDKDSEDIDTLSQGLPVLMGSLGVGIDNERNGMYSQLEEEDVERSRAAFDRTKYVFNEISAKLFPSVKVPSTFNEAFAILGSLRIKLSGVHEGLPGLIRAHLSYTQNEKRPKELVNSLEVLLSQIGQHEYHSGNYGQVSQALQPFGVSSPSKHLEIAKIAYQLSLVLGVIKQEEEKRAQKA